MNKWLYKAFAVVIFLSAGSIVEAQESARRENCLLCKRLAEGCSTDVLFVPPQNRNQCKILIACFEAIYDHLGVRGFGRCYNNDEACSPTGYYSYCPKAVFPKDDPSGHMIWNCDQACRYVTEEVAQ